MTRTICLVWAIAAGALLTTLGSSASVASSGNGWSAESSTHAKGPKVEIYVADWCPYCKRLEQYLTERKIRFVRHDIEASTAAAARHKSLGGGGVPLTVIGSKVIRGFNERALQEALGGFPASERAHDNARARGTP
jgi:glutaredoxin